VRRDDGVAIHIGPSRGVADRHGPSFLADSLGGYIGYLTAATLSAAGRSVAFLGILDTSLLTETTESHLSPTPMAHLQIRRGKIARSLTHFIFRGIRDRLVKPRWALLLRLAARLSRLPLPGSVGFHLRWDLNRDLIRDMIRRHRVPMADSRKQLLAPTVLFRTAAHALGSAEDLGWRRFALTLASGG
jgi:thioesterase domain-containing protein